MADQPSSHEPTTFFGNFVTANINSDELVLEVRDVRLPHKDTLKGAAGASVVDVPAPTPEQIYAIEPVARIVLTFTTAKFLKNFLDNAFPTAEKNRKA